MFDYGNANEAQREAINIIGGLVLITAGPGTGKTFTLVKRAVYLIQECGIKPEQIMMATFTEKAAKELITRITNELAERNISVNVNEMYIGTFHSLCLRIIKENLEFTRLKRNYRLLDTFDQKYLVFRNFHRFKNIEGIDELLSKGGSWKRSDEICTYINHLSEEMVDIEALQSDDNPEIRTLGRVLSVYQEMLEEGNLIDFSTIQTECYKLLMQNKQILEELQDKLQYLMIDEYQDTNYIQEQIVFLLGATPYVNKQVLPEVVYAYGLNESIAHGYLKDADPIGFENVKNEEFLRTSITKFWERYGGKTYEGLLPKLAIFAANVKEATDVVRPVVEKVLSELGISLSTVLVNTGDPSVTKDEDIKNFNNLDVIGTEGSKKQFIILVEKGREGWNCRSLLGIALFRSPKSKVFVLQATMRCLRQLTKEQLKATIFLSKENYDTLDDELRKNYNMEISDFGKSPNTNKKVYKVRVLPPPRSIKMKRLWHEYSLIKKEFNGYYAATNR